MELGNWRKKRGVIRHYDELAASYDHLYGDEQNLKIKTALDAIQISDSDLVLDVGCGTGFLFDQIGGSVNFFVGIDVSLGLLKVATSRSKHLQKKTFSLIRADADHMPFLEEVFDKVFALTLLQNMPDSTGTLREIIRIAKKDATIVVTGLKKSFSEEMFKSILSKAGLGFSIIKKSEQAQDIIAVCRKYYKVKNK